jgi:hypothetical protein
MVDSNEAERQLETSLLIWGLLTRGISFVYLFSFTTLFSQIPLLYSLSSVQSSLLEFHDSSERELNEFIHQMRMRFHGYRVSSILERLCFSQQGVRFSPFLHLLFTLDRFRRFPSLCWLCNSTFFCQVICVVGILSSLLAFCGISLFGCSTSILFFSCWLIWLHFMTTFPIFCSFPWDCMLAECFLCIMLPSLHPIYASLSITSTPPTLLALSFRVLLARVLYGFAKLKFYGKWWEHLDYIKWFLMGQPLPSPVACIVFKMSPALHSVLLFGMFFAEVIAPFAMFLPLPYWMSCCSAVAVIALMLGIALCGCFGVFNLLTSVFCLVGFDPCYLSSSDLFSISVLSPSSLILLVWLIFGTMNFPYNSWRVTWCSNVMPLSSVYSQWPFKYLVKFMCFFAPLRLSHPYGVFSIKTPDKYRPCIGFEISIDKQKTWHMFHYDSFPHRPNQPLRFLSPYQPRFDYVSVYAGHAPILTNIKVVTLLYGAKALLNYQ